MAEVGVVDGADLHPAGGVNGSTRGAVSRKIRQPLLDFSVAESRLMTGDGSRRVNRVSHCARIHWTCKTKRRSISLSLVASVTKCSASHCTVFQCRNKRKTL